MPISKERRPAVAAAMVASLLFAFLMPHDQQDAAAQALLYDNTDHTRYDENGRSRMLWVGPSEEGEWFDAQPFKLGGHDNVASVSIPMARGPSVRATGTIRVSIWDDNGRGFPGQEVGELGVVDITTLERFDFPGLCPDPCVDSLPLITFESTIDDLMPGTTHYVFIDYRGLDSIGRGEVLVGLSNDRAGSNRAAGALYGDNAPVPPFEDSDWIPTRNLRST